MFATIYSIKKTQTSETDLSEMALFSFLYQGRGLGLFWGLFLRNQKARFYVFILFIVQKLFKTTETPQIWDSEQSSPPS